MSDSLCWVSRLSVTSCLVLGVAAAAAVECQLEVAWSASSPCLSTHSQWFTAAVRLTSSSLHYSVWTQSDQVTIPLLVFTSPDNTLHTAEHAGSVLGSSEHVDGRMEKWLFCSVQCECVNSAVDPGCYHLGSASIQTKDPGEAMPLYQHVSNNVSSDSSFTVGLLLFPRLLKLFRRVADVTRGLNTSDKHHRPAGSRTGTNSDFLWVHLV